MDSQDPGYAKYIRYQRSTEELLRQFLKTETGLGKSDAYKRGHAFSFEWTQEQRDEVNALMAQGMDFESAFDKVNNGHTIGLDKVSEERSEAVPSTQPELESSVR